MYIIYVTNTFEKEFHKLSTTIQEQFQKKINKLKKQPFQGKPLGTKQLRELKANKFRVYFLIKEEELIILLLTTSDKKLQQKTICALKQNIEDIQKNINNKNNKEYTNGKRK